MNSCKNCKSDFEGNFCNNCGQKLITKRITLKKSIAWIFSSVFNLDKGFFFTTKELILKPGETINNFLNGVTVRYMHPFRFLFIWATISALIGIYLNVYEETELMVNRMAGQTEEQLEKSREMLKSFNQYMSFVMMAMIPFIAFGTYLVNRSKKLNYAEHLVMVAYGNGSSIVIGLPLILAYLFVDNHQILSATSLVLGMIVMGRVASKTMDDHIVVGTLKYALGFLIGFILVMIVSIILSIAIGLIAVALGMGNPFA